MCISMLLMGCWVYEEFVSFANDGEVPWRTQKSTQQTDTPAPYYDSGDDAAAAEGAASEAPIFDNQNILAVQNGGTSPTFKVSSPTTVTKIQNYHWNDAAGNGSTGQISLKAGDGKVYGPWETVGTPGQGDVPNAYWTASPNVTLPAGSYTIIDSDPGTWSQNADSGGVGFAQVYAESGK
jgi:hypothetical protein